MIVVGANTILIYQNDQVNMRTLQYGSPALTFVNAIIGTMIWMIIADMISCLKIEKIEMNFQYFQLQ